MNDYFYRLAARALGLGAVIEPLRASMFDPALEADAPSELMLALEAEARVAPSLPSPEWGGEVSREPVESSAFEGEADLQPVESNSVSAMPKLQQTEASLPSHMDKPSASLYFRREPKGEGASREQTLESERNVSGSEAPQGSYGESAALGADGKADEPTSLLAPEKPEAEKASHVARPTASFSFEGEDKSEEATSQQTSEDTQDVVGSEASHASRREGPAAPFSLGGEGRDEGATREQTLKSERNVGGSEASQGTYPASPAFGADDKDDEPTSLEAPENRQDASKPEAEKASHLGRPGTSLSSGREGSDEEATSLQTPEDMQDVVGSEASHASRRGGPATSFSFGEGNKGQEATSEQTSDNGADVVGSDLADNVGSGDPGAPNHVGPAAGLRDPLGPSNLGEKKEEEAVHEQAVPAHSSSVSVALGHPAEISSQTDQEPGGSPGGMGLPPPRSLPTAPLSVGDSGGRSEAQSLDDRGPGASAEPMPGAIQPVAGSRGSDVQHRQKEVGEASPPSVSTGDAGSAERERGAMLEPERKPASASIGDLSHLGGEPALDSTTTAGLASEREAENVATLPAAPSAETGSRHPAGAHQEGSVAQAPLDREGLAGGLGSSEQTRGTPGNVSTPPPDLVEVGKGFAKDPAVHGTLATPREGAILEPPGAATGPSGQRAFLEVSNEEEVRRASPGNPIPAASLTDAPSTLLPEAHPLPPPDGRQALRKVKGDGVEGSSEAVLEDPALSIPKTGGLSGGAGDTDGGEIERSSAPGGQGERGTPLEAPSLGPTRGESVEIASEGSRGPGFEAASALEAPKGSSSFAEGEDGGSAPVAASDQGFVRPGSLHEEMAIGSDTQNHGESNDNPSRESGPGEPRHAAGPGGLAFSELPGAEPSPSSGVGEGSSHPPIDAETGSLGLGSVGREGVSGEEVIGPDMPSRKAADILGKPLAPVTSFPAPHEERSAGKDGRNTDELAVNSSPAGAKASGDEDGSAGSTVGRADRATSAGSSELSPSIDPIAEDGAQIPLKGIGEHGGAETNFMGNDLGARQDPNRSEGVGAGPTGLAGSEVSVELRRPAEDGFLHIQVREAAQRAETVANSDSKTNQSSDTSERLPEKPIDFAGRTASDASASLARSIAEVVPQNPPANVNVPPSPDPEGITSLNLRLKNPSGNPVSRVVSEPLQAPENPKLARHAVVYPDPTGATSGNQHLAPSTQNPAGSREVLSPSLTGNAPGQPGADVASISPPESTLAVGSLTQARHEAGLPPPPQTRPRLSDARNPAAQTGEARDGDYKAERLPPSLDSTIEAAPGSESILASDPLAHEVMSGADKSKAAEAEGVGREGDLDTPKPVDITSWANSIPDSIASHIDVPRGEISDSNEAEVAAKGTKPQPSIPEGTQKAWIEGRTDAWSQVREMPGGTQNGAGVAEPERAIQEAPLLSVHRPDGTFAGNVRQGATGHAGSDGDPSEGDLLTAVAHPTDSLQDVSSVALSNSAHMDAFNSGLGGDVSRSASANSRHQDAAKPDLQQWDRDQASSSEQPLSRGEERSARGAGGSSSGASFSPLPSPAVTTKLPGAPLFKEPALGNVGSMAPSPGISFSEAGANAGILDLPIGGAETTPGPPGFTTVTARTRAEILNPAEVRLREQPADGSPAPTYHVGPEAFPSERGQSSPFKPPSELAPGDQSDDIRLGHARQLESQGNALVEKVNQLPRHLTDEPTFKRPAGNADDVPRPSRLDAPSEPTSLFFPGSGLLIAPVIPKSSGPTPSQTQTHSVPEIDLTTEMSSPMTSAPQVRRSRETEGGNKSGRGTTPIEAGQFDIRFAEGETSTGSIAQRPDAPMPKADARGQTSSDNRTHESSPVAATIPPREHRAPSKSQDSLPLSQNALDSNSLASLPVVQRKANNSPSKGPEPSAGSQQADNHALPANNDRNLLPHPPAQSKSRPAPPVHPLLDGEVTGALQRIARHNAKATTEAPRSSTKNSIPQDLRIRIGKIEIPPLPHASHSHRAQPPGVSLSDYLSRGMSE